MKKVKFSFVAAMVFVAAIVFSAFTVPAKPVKTTDLWFEYMGVGAKDDAGSYKIYGEGTNAPAGCPSEEEDICAVQLPASTVAGHTDEPDMEAFSVLYGSTNELQDVNAKIRHRPVQ